MVELFIDHLPIDSISGTATRFKLNKPTYNYKLSDKGGITYSLAYDQLDEFGFAIEQDGFAPKRTDYALQLSTDGGVNVTTLQDGILDDVMLKMGSGMLTVQGYDFLSFIDQGYPFPYEKSPEDISDASAVVTDNKVVSDFVVAWTQIEQQSVISDLLDAVNNIGSTGIAFTSSFAGTGWNELLTYTILMMDETTLLSHIKSIGGLNSPYGFDFKISPGQHITFTAPRLVIPSNAVFPVATFYRDENVLDCEWHNKGPLGTSSVSIGNSLAEVLWKESHFDASTDLYRKWLTFTELGLSFRQQAQIERAAAAVGYIQRNPQKSLTLTIKPEDFNPSDETDGYKNHVGEAVWYDSGDLFMPYHRVDAAHWIIDQQYRTDDNRNWVLDLGLQQIFTA